jgi:hypothetical protein
MATGLHFSRVQANCSSLHNQLQTGLLRPDIVLAAGSNFDWKTQSLDRYTQNEEIAAADRNLTI